MFLYRLTKAKYAKELSGTGASKLGGRWNSKGTEVIYTSESRALALAELAVHLSIIDLPKDYMLLVIEIEQDVKINEVKNLPTDWNNIPSSPSTQYLGDDFIKSNSALILKVPSAVVKGDFNYLINPFHPDFKKGVKIVECTPFPMDQRLF